MQQVTLLFRILEVPVSNLGPEIGYPEKIFLVFLSLSRKMPG
jgi:hypothetical protein